MKRLLYIAQIVLFILFITSVLLAIQEFGGTAGPFAKLNQPQPSYNYNEEFDPSLKRLNDIKKLRIYCDSVYEERRVSPNYTAAEKEYPQIASETVRKRFYHGISSYGFGDNYLGYVANPSYFGMYLNVPVKSNDILKFPYGICSQQAVVVMDLLNEKGYKTRKVGFYSKAVSGHFCYEVFYRGSWHFFDTDLEPDMAVLNSYDRPGIKFLVDHPDILQKAYKKMEPAKVAALFPTFFYGKPNEVIARNATIFQQVTRFLSYSIWIFFLLSFLWVRRKSLRLSNHRYVRNRRISLSDLQPG